MQNVLMKERLACSTTERLTNPLATKLVMIEVQSDDYLGEDNIVRFKDHYGRA